VGQIVRLLPLVVALDQIYLGMFMLERHDIAYVATG